MSDLLKALESRVSSSDWELMANHAGVSVEELKNNLLSVLVEEGKRQLNNKQEDQGVVIPVLSSIQANGDCETQDFELSLFKIIGVKGSLTLCGSGSSWSAELKICLVVAGSSVWCTSYRFDPHNLSVCFSPSVGIAKAKLCFNLDIETNKVCLRLNGNACVWAFGWHCGSFDTSLFCIPLP
ncbi:MAG: hypothetical protein ACRBFS_00270 [Aureispira sp.]